MSGRETAGHENNKALLLFLFVSLHSFHALFRHSLLSFPTFLPFFSIMHSLLLDLIWQQRRQENSKTTSIKSQNKTIGAKEGTSCAAEMQSDVSDWRSSQQHKTITDQQIKQWTSKQRWKRWRHEEMTWAGSHDNEHTRPRMRANNKTWEQARHTKLLNKMRRGLDTDPVKKKTRNWLRRGCASQILPLCCCRSCYDILLFLFQLADLNSAVLFLLFCELLRIFFCFLFILVVCPFGLCFYL